MIFPLLQDFADALAALPREHPRRRILTLLDEALRRDVHFIDRHPTTFFQCMWNTCWWYDCTEAAEYYVGGRVPGEGESIGLCRLAERWSADRDRSSGGAPWLRSLRPPAKHLGIGQGTVLRGFATGIAFLPDGRQIVSAGSDGEIFIWDAVTGQRQAGLSGCAAAVSALTCAPDGRLAAGACEDDVVRIWDLTAGRIRFELPLRDAWVNGVAFSPDGRCLAAGCGYEIRVWDTTDGSVRIILEGHENRVSSVVFSPDGRNVVSGGHDLTLRVWDVADGRLLRVLGGHSNWVKCVAWSPDGLSLASGSLDKNVMVWDALSGEPRRTLEGHEDWVLAVSYSPDGRLLASGSRDQTVRLWDAATGALLQTWRGHGATVHCVAFAPDGRHVVSGAEDGHARVWAVGAGRPALELIGPGSHLESLRYSTDGRLILGSNRLFVGYNQGREERSWAWDAATGKARLSVPLNDPGIVDAAASPDGRLIATVSGGEVRLWDAGQREVLHWTGYDLDIVCVAFAPDGRRLATGMLDGPVRIWDTGDHRLLMHLEGLEGGVGSVAFSADGRELAACAVVGLRVWDATTGQPRLALQQAAMFEKLWYTRDGRRLVSDAFPGNLSIWDVASGECLASIESATPQKAFAAGLAEFAWYAQAGAHETAIKSSANDRTAAWWPERFENYGSAHFERCWATQSDANLVLFRLEGPDR